MYELVQIFLLFNFKNRREKFLFILINISIMIKEYQNFSKNVTLENFFELILGPALIFIIYIENHVIWWYCYLILWACGLWNLNLILFTFFRFACEFDGYDLTIETIGLYNDE